MLLVRAASIMRESGRGLGLGNFDFFGPQMALAYWLDAISQGPLALVMDAARIKSITHGPYKLKEYK
jgi:hypothetical protein